MQLAAGTAASAVVYPPARVALNVPCFEGLSLTSGENSTSPVIRSAVSNFPLNTSVPASRPTLPSINSTGPENATEFPSPPVHFAAEGLAGPHTFNLGSSNRKVPFPALCASKRNERLSPFVNVMSTFQVPIMFGDCAWDKAARHVWATTIGINARVAFMGALYLSKADARQRVKVYFGFWIFLVAR